MRENEKGRLFFGCGLIGRSNSKEFLSKTSIDPLNLSSAIPYHTLSSC